MREDPLFEIRDLTKKYAVREGGILSSLFSDQKYLRAVDQVSFDIHQGDIVGLAGQSGCGKSTLGELLVGLVEPSSGTIRYKGRDLSEFDKEEMKEFRRDIQIIFQDPYESLNPRYTVGQTVTEPLKIHNIGSPEEREARIVRALEDSGLTPPENYIPKLPSELSGGERQRVSIARALVLDPSFLVADEPVSMLDVSVSTGILNQFKKLKDRKDLTLLYISHDLATIRYITDETIIMYLGDIVEMGNTGQIIDYPAHPYTEQLLSAVPNPDPDEQRLGTDIDSSISNTVDIPSGCRFRDNCKYAKEKCKQEPDMESINSVQEAACFYPVSSSKSEVENV
ncbi:oligopeptide/dipeptide ABC transporter ATP-binding protein [Halorubrum trueperi]|uniref:Oligopeptide/dipeptide ABC transporter ATP-binding protein n=1 Tax=Halorubrum trueperi TaxID=2004704 RepID=A0ABD5UKH8_9EURY